MTWLRRRTLCQMQEIPSCQSVQISWHVLAVRRSKVSERAQGMSKIRIRLAAEIRVAREAAGLTLKDVAERVATSVDELSKIERGLKQPTLETLAALILALQINPARLFAVDVRTDLTLARCALEVEAAKLIGAIDDEVLLALIQIGHTIAPLKKKSASAPMGPTASVKTAGHDTGRQRRK